MSSPKRNATLAPGSPGSREGAESPLFGRLESGAEADMLYRLHHPGDGPSGYRAGSMWDVRGERVTEAPSTSTNSPARRAAQQQGPQQAVLHRRRDLHTQPAANSPSSTRRGPGASSQPKLPHLSQRLSSAPASPGPGPASQRPSVNGGFIAGATVAGPISAQVAASAPTPAPPSSGRAPNIATSAAAMFAIASGNTLAAASIAYNTGGGGITVPPTPSGGEREVSSPMRPSMLNTNLGPTLDAPPTSASPGPGQRGLRSQMSMGQGEPPDEEVGFGELPREDVLAENERLRGRIVSLPNILCRSANGDVFMVDLGNVQAMMAVKREAIAEAVGLTGVTPSPLPRIAGGSAAGRRRRRLARQAAAAGLTDDDAPGLGPTSALDPSPSSRSISPDGGPPGAGMGGPGAISTRVRAKDAVDAAVRQHLAATDAAVEARRQQLEADWRAGRNTGVSAAAVQKEQDEARRAAAIDFAINTFVPRKLAAMALNMHVPKQEAAPVAKPDPDAASITFGAGFKAAAASKQSASWGKMQAGMERLYDKMPFMSSWQDAIKKMKRDDSLGWDDLLSGGNELYVKGRGEHQGTNIYVLKCQELGVTPSTQVVQQLASPDSNMSHCKLGRQGAAALRHALSANVTITHLNLQDNFMDATAVEDVLAGLYNGTMAKHPHARKMLERRTHALAQKDSGGLHALAPPPLVIPNPSAAPSAAPTSRGPRIVLPQPSRRVAHGDLDVRLIPASLAKEQEQRRQAEEDRQRREEAKRAEAEAEQARAQAAATAAAANGLTDAPEWLRIINDPARLAALEAGRQSTGPRGESRGGTRSGNRARSPDLPARKPRPAPSTLPNTSLTSSITSLDLSDNPLGINGVRALAELLDPTVTPYQFLKHLQLNKCGIPEAGGRALGLALSRGNTRLAVLGLSNNQLGNKTAAMFGELLALVSGLEELDLSWNQIKSEGAKALAAGVAQNNLLTRLNLSWNGLENAGVVAVGSMLSTNDALTFLDLTNTRMGSEACLMLAEGIKVNRTLEVLILNGNSVGDDGARFLMDALKANTSLQYLGLQGSNMSAAVRGHSGANAFNPLSPDGTYLLNLSLAPDRAVAAQLAELDAASPVDLMKNIRLGDKNVPSCKAMRWPESLPVSGMLAFDFVSKRTSRAMAVMEAKKFTALATQFGEGTMSDKEKLTLVEVMAPFNYLYCHQAATLLKAFTIGDEMVLAAALLFTRAADLDDNITAISEALQADTSQNSLHDVLGWYSYTRFSNPTGHYELNLNSKVHQALATRLKDTAYSEPVDAVNWLNVIHDMYTTQTKVPGNFGPPELWKGLVPHSGTLSLDYVSAILAPEDAAPVGEALLNEVLVQDLGIELDPAGQPVPCPDYAVASEQVARLRPIVANMAFTAAQVKKLVDAFEASPHRVEVFVTCYCLIVDRKNVWTILYGLTALEQGLAMWRLGPANLFDRAHPTAHYILDLGNPAHEQVARKLVDLANATPELPNFWNIRLNGVKRSVHENRNMWGTFTAETASPFLECDFIGADGFEVLGRTKQEVDALGPGDRLDLRTKQARRMELSRAKAMYAYFEDGSGWARPAWQSRPLLMRPLADKAPWQAAWDRLLRLLLRSDLRCGDMEGDSPLEDVFFNATGGEEAMTGEQWEALLKDWGYGRLEIMHMRDAFDTTGRPATQADGPAFKPYAAGKPGTPSGRSGAGTPTHGGGAVSRSTSRHPARPASQAGLAPGGSDTGEPRRTESRGSDSGIIRTLDSRGGTVSGGEEDPAGGSPGAQRDRAVSGSGLGTGSSPERGRAKSSLGNFAAPGGALPTIPDSPGGTTSGALIPNTVVEFPAFVELFMREPPKALRFLHASGAVAAAGATAAARARRGRR
ncbi:hypothetical protein HYH03_004155 [Edaphochlamys debaryana]|uniref:DUF4476 domain-containing protein n=1 Tax=Edaphochlamys debaryana TaxID=47281 RepID=A0A836C3P0_9CHLO|nr:hypothetical protein HYH03_004155 [Edaphochlamys debaryana]|eukprot:KAG2497889.1 hypothetical protein HYH03_004155 [Edaphochlamys debaryana]